MLILGIETSCDETGVALYDTREGLLADALHSQVELHALYGGVVPELASRDHVRRLLPLVRAVLEKAGKSLDDVGLVAYTQGPGLGGALLVGASAFVKWAGLTTVWFCDLATATSGESATRNTSLACMITPSGGDRRASARSGRGARGTSEEGRAMMVVRGPPEASRGTTPA